MKARLALALLTLWVLLRLGTTPELTVDINRTRWYRNPNRHANRPVYRGVTGVVAALPKEAIPRWAAKEVAEYAVSYSEQWLGLPAHEAVDLLKGYPWRYRDRRAATGSEVHAVMERMIRGEDFEPEAAIEPWVAALRLFVAETGPVPEIVERPVYNEDKFHAGTPDFVGRLQAFPELKRMILDWKTGAGLYPDMGVQVVGGYALGGQYYLDQSNQEVEWRPPDSAALVHLTPNGTYRIVPLPMDKRFRRAFLAALEIRQWEAEFSKLPEPIRAPENWNLVWTRDKLRAMDTATRLELSVACQDLGIPTKWSELTENVAALSQLMGLIKVFEMRALPADHPAARPMP